MRLPAKLCVVVSFLALALPGHRAWAWGAEGHEVVADIAQRLMTPNAIQNARALLALENHTSIDQVASWADMARMQRPETEGWHFVNIPISTDKYDPARDCRGGDCIVDQLSVQERLLATPSTDPRIRLEALKFVVHFVGDIHQPLHCADNHDHGGNAIRVAGFGRNANLHRLWDTDLIEREGFPPQAMAATLLKQLTQDMANRWSSSGFVDWANESHDFAVKVAYGKLPPHDWTNNVTIDAEYQRAATEVINLQLLRAGVRLAAVLNAALR